MLKSFTDNLAKVLMAWLLFVALAGAVEKPVSGRLVERCPPTPNCVSSRDREEARYVRSLSFEGPSDEAWQDLKTALLEEPRTAIIDQSSRTLRLEATSLVFGFVDDLEFELMPEEHAIDVRSASRAGYWDMGVNRRRVERIRERFNALMARR